MRRIEIGIDIGIVTQASRLSLSRIAVSAVILPKTGWNPILLVLTGKMPILSIAQASLHTLKDFNFLTDL